MKDMSLKELGQYFDHALLRADVTIPELAAFCDEGVRLSVKMLAVNPAAVMFCKDRVAGSGVLVGAAVGFPLGQSTLETKIAETKDAIARGSDEIDYVINVGAFKSGHREYIVEEMQEIVAVCREKNVIAKVIFENCYLTDDEKKALCEIANEVRPDYIKTSTGFGTGGATVADVKLMRAYADPAIKVKASGGIKTLEDVRQLIEAGALRIGTSNTAGIMDAFAKRGGF